MKRSFYSVIFIQETGLGSCNITRKVLHLADGVRLGGGERACRSGWVRGMHAPTVWAHRSMSLPWWYDRHDCGDAKCGRAVCPHIAVNAQAARSTVVARRGRLALLCGHAGRVTLPAAVAERPPYGVGGRESGNCAGGMAVNLTKYIRPCYIILRKFTQYTEIISMNLCITEVRIDINYRNRNALVDMPSDNRDSCLTLSLSDSVAMISLIYRLSLQLDRRNATICGQGGKSHV